LGEKLIDFAAAGRVANRVELKDIRLVDVSAKCNPKIKGTLEPTLSLDCAVANRQADVIEIACDYRFTAKVAESEAAEAGVKYLLSYQVNGTEPLVDEDLAEFAVGNGTLHSWPFVREFLHGLTSKMGYPPYTLPVFHFKPKPPIAAPQTPSEPTRPKPGA
jgi:preprotein translocase subunit SecB